MDWPEIAAKGLAGTGRYHRITNLLIQPSEGGARGWAFVAQSDGTGFVEARWADGEIGPNQARVAISKTDRGLAWGGVHWQYLDDVANVPAVHQKDHQFRDVRRVVPCAFDVLGTEEQMGAEANVALVAVPCILVNQSRFAESNVMYSGF